MGLSIAQAIIYGVFGLLSLAITSIALIDYIKTDDDELLASLSDFEIFLILAAIVTQYLQVAAIVYSLVTIKKDLSNILNGIISWLVIGFSLTSYLLTYTEYQETSAESSFIDFPTDQIIQLCLAISLAFRYGIPFFGTDQKASRICDFGGYSQTDGEEER